MENITAIGMDMSKHIFHLHGVNHCGRQLLRKKVRREKLLEELSQLPTGCRVFMEAGQAAHYWGRELRRLELVPALIAPKAVKPFVQSHKNDYRDAEAICEAGRRPSQRFVPLKTVGQQELQTMHKVRERLVGNKTALGNQVRGIAMEHGVILPVGASSVRRFLETQLEHSGLSQTIKEILRKLGDEFMDIEQRIVDLEKQLELRSKQSTTIKRIRTIPGVGLLTATALCTVSGNMGCFKNGRQFAAFIGLVPRQCTTGGKTRLLGVTKQGNAYLRHLLIQGAVAVIRHVKKKDDPYSLWIRKLHAAKGTRRTAVAIANKNARIAWRIITSQAQFDSSQLLRAA
jgi:transposase